MRHSKRRFVRWIRAPNVVLKRDPLKSSWHEARQGGDNLAIRGVLLYPKEEKSSRRLPPQNVEHTRKDRLRYGEGEDRVSLMTTEGG